MTEQSNRGRDVNGEGPRGLLAELPTDRLKAELEGFVGAAVGHGVHVVTEKLTSIAEGSGGKGKMLAAGVRAVGEGKSPMRALTSAGLAGLKDKLGQAFSGGKGGGGGGKIKVTNIVEQIDVGVPVDVAYNQWTQFGDFPSFMKKVENVSQDEDEELTFKAQIFWSHRSWTATIIEQIPDQRIVWQSEGDKGYVDGAVTFHELAPDLTRIILALEYHPQGFFERTGNLWRAQGRRVRLELKHFQRHVMTDTILHADEVEGWRGEIRDGEVVREPGEEDESVPADESEPEDAYEEPEDADEESGEYDEEPAEPEDSAPAGEEPDEYDEEPDGYEDEPEDQDAEYDEPAGQEPAGEEDPLEDDEPAEDEEAPANGDARRRRVRAEGR